MKPLLQKDLTNFLNRFENFVDGEIRTLEVISPTTIKLSIATQDVNRGFDWLVIEFELSGVSDAKLLEASKLSHVDMCDGVSILCENDSYILSIGNNETFSASKNSVIYVSCNSIKYDELSF